MKRAGDCGSRAASKHLFLVAWVVVRVAMERVDEALHLIELIEQGYPAGIGDPVGRLRTSSDELLCAGDISNRFQLLQVSAERSVCHAHALLERGEVQRSIRLNAVKTPSRIGP